MSDQTSSPNNGTLPLAQATRLVDLLAIEPAAVVSRVLLKRKTGNITLFTFDRGQGLSEHTAPFDAYVQVLEGELELTIGGKPVRATVGEAVVMPANVPHALSAIGPVKMLLVMIRDPG